MQLRAAGRAVRRDASLRCTQCPSTLSGAGAAGRPAAACMSRARCSAASSAAPCRACARARTRVGCLQRTVQYKLQIQAADELWDALPRAALARRPRRPWAPRGARCRCAGQGASERAAPRTRPGGSGRGRIQGDARRAWQPNTRAAVQRAAAIGHALPSSARTAAPGGPPGRAGARGPPAPRAAPSASGAGAPGGGTAADISSSSSASARAGSGSS